jgi:UDP-4-amino-4,6-dideoxy-N-acetyl-beta-L-altrosamine N-acetyltransferase
LLKFRKLKESDLEQVLKWRTMPEVTRFMTTDIDYNMEKQKAWFDRVDKDKSVLYWIIEIDNRPIGVINLSEIDLVHRRCSIGYYIGEVESRSIGFMVPPYVYNFVFNKMGLNKIYGEVVDGNGNLLKMHKMHGWRNVGTYSDHIFKYGQYFDVHIVELMASDWKALGNRFGRFIADFES